MARMVLTLDEDDYATIQNEIAKRQAESRRLWPGEGTVLPEGDSCRAGALLAECIRDLDEYRCLYDVEH